VGKSVTTPYTPIASPWGIVYPPRNEVYNRFVRVVHPNQFSKLFSFPFVPAFRSTTVCTLILKSTLKIATSLSAHQDSKSITTIDKCISLATWARGRYADTNGFLIRNITNLCSNGASRKVNRELKRTFLSSIYKAQTKCSRGFAPFSRSYAPATVQYVWNMCSYGSADSSPQHCWTCRCRTWDGIVVLSTQGSVQPLKRKRTPHTNCQTAPRTLYIAYLHGYLRYACWCNCTCTCINRFWVKWDVFTLILL